MSIRFLYSFRIIVAVLVLGGSISLAQEETQPLSIPIDTVVVIGNEKTNDDVILREIPFAIPGSLTEADLQVIQNRLTNLFLFHRVQLSVYPAGESNMLLIEVAEAWYIYPVPIVFQNNRSWSDISYGFQVSHTNFRGRNENVSIGGWLGYNPTFFARYNNPWIGGDARLILGLQFFYRSVRNRFFDLDSPDRFPLLNPADPFSEFNERHLFGRVTVGKGFSLNSSAEAGVSLRRITMPAESELVNFEQTGFTYDALTVSGGPTDLVPQLSLQFRSDHRDLVEYPMKGYYLLWRVTRSGITDNQAKFWRLDVDHRAYLKLTSRISLAGRNRTVLHRGTLPHYDRMYIGFGERIRGYFHTRLTDQNLMVHNYEMRFRILNFRYLSWKEAPLLPAFFQQLKYGLSAALFVDSGILWDQPEQFALRNHLSGFGAGLHFHLPYIYLLRLDHTWNDQGNREWLLEARVVF